MVSVSLLWACGGGETTADAQADGPALESGIDLVVGEDLTSDGGAVDGPFGDAITADAVNLWAPIGARLKKQLDDGKVPGGFILLDVYDGDGALVYSVAHGTKTRDDSLAVASASKLVSSTVLLSLVGAGTLSLAGTTGDSLGWIGPAGNVTLAQLMGFTSGLQDAVCTYNPSSTSEQCVATIRSKGLEADPDTTFHYHGGHMAVAGRMAEVETGKSWAEIFDQLVVQPLGLAAGTQYYALPQQRLGEGNPLVAGGLVISAADYGKFLTALQGLPSGPGLISAALFEQQHAERWPSGMQITDSPNGNIHYGFGCWRQCATPNVTTLCDQDLLIHSAGAFGFVPFIDKRYGFYGVLGAEAPTTGTTLAVDNVALLFDELRPLIASALGR